MRSMYFFSAACILAATSAITVELTGENNDAPSSPASFGQDDETFGQTESEVGASSVEYPEADCCFFYSEKKYSGNKTMHCTTDQNENAGEWIKVEDQFMPNPITRSWKYVNSYRCGKNVKMNVCQRNGASNDSTGQCDKYAGYKYHISSTSGAMSVPELGYALHNDVRSYKLEKYDEKTNGATTLFQGPYCDGYSASFAFVTTKTDESAKSRYIAQNLLDMSSCNSVGSIMVPYNYYVKLYPKDQAAGEPQVEYGPSSPKTPMNCVSLGSDKNYSQTSSLEIYRKPDQLSPPSLQGNWELISSNRFDFQFEMTSGVEKQDDMKNTDSDKSSNQFDASATISLIPGVGHLLMPDIWSVTVAGSSKSEQAQVNEAAQMSATNSSIKISGWCKNDPTKGYGASLYQWTLSSPDRSVKVAGVGICRNKQDHMIKPACLPVNCDWSTQCSKCKDLKVATVLTKGKKKVDPVKIDPQPKITKAVTTVPVTTVPETKNVRKFVKKEKK